MVLTEHRDSHTIALLESFDVAPNAFNDAGSVKASWRRELERLEQVWYERCPPIQWLQRGSLDLDENFGRTRDGNWLSYKRVGRVARGKHEGFLLRHC